MKRVYLLNDTWLLRYLWTKSQNKIFLHVGIFDVKLSFFAFKPCHWRFLTSLFSSGCELCRTEGNDCGPSGAQSQLDLGVRCGVLILDSTPCHAVLIAHIRLVQGSELVLRCAFLTQFLDARFFKFSDKLPFLTILNVLVRFLLFLLFVFMEKIDFYLDFSNTSAVFIFALYCAGLSSTVGDTFLLRKRQLQEILCKSKEQIICKRLQF